MKQFLPLIAFVLGAITTNAQTGSLLINDNFTTLNAGDLSPANNASSGWTGQNNSPYVQVASTTPMVYSGYASGTNYVTVARANSADDPYKNFIGSTTVNAAASSFYVSFVVRVANSANTGTAGGTLDEVVSLRNAAGTALCSFYLGDDGTNLEMGIAKGSGASASTVWTNNNYSFNTTYLVILKYNFVSGNTNDQMYMWVNPSLASEPTTGTAALSITGATTDPTAPGTSAISALQLQQINSGATADFDGFKAAYGTGSTQAANSAFAWSTLSPAGATLPVKISYFNAAKGTDYNTLNWRAECTSAQATFVVERSSNGTDFTAINTFTATQQRCQQPFDFTDYGTAAKGTVYYRLKVIDENGKVNYSAIVKVAADQNDMQLVSVAPNPVINVANISIASVKKDNVELQVISMEGKVVYKTLVTVQPGTSVVNLDVTSLQKGMYIIKGSFANGGMSTVKFSK